MRVVILGDPPDLPRQRRTATSAPIRSRTHLALALKEAHMDALVPHGLNGPHRSLPNRRTLVKGAAWAAPTLLVATTAPAVAASFSFDSQARA